jgi:hypothetical protein
MSIAYKVERAAVGEQDFFPHFFQVSSRSFSVSRLLSVGASREEIYTPLQVRPTSLGDD